MFKKNQMCTKQINTKYRNGSALIITMLVIAVISAIAFSVGRLTVSEIRKTSQLEDSMMAYYAAESGIEQGLLMWRYNHDVEAPNNGMLEEDESTFRVNLTDMSTNTANINYVPEGDGKTAFYDLRIWYKDTEIGNPADVNDEDNPELRKDNYAQFDVTEAMGNNVEIRWSQPITDNNYSGLYTSVEYIVYEEDENGNLVIATDQFGDPMKGLTTIDKIDQDLLIPNDINKKYFVKIKPYVGDSFNSDLFVNNSAPSAAQNPRIKYTVKDNDEQKPIGTSYSYIESTGYYGNSKRKLQIKIDRYSGAILGPYDLVIYQGE